MPLYEYQCRKCGYIFEEVVFSQLPKIETKCSNCKKGITKKLISVGSFQIKGYSEKNGYSKEN